jgi:hypothetical protein
VKKSILIIILIPVLSFQLAYGQDEAEKFAINPKLGMFNNFSSVDGFVYGTEMNLLKNNLLYSIDYYRLDEFNILGPLPSVVNNHAGFMLGNYKGDRYFRVNYQAGLSMFWGNKRTHIISSGSGWFGPDTYATEDFYTIGIPVKLGFKVIPFHFMAIGIDFQANINLKNPVIMPLISLELGNLREKITNK